MNLRRLFLSHAAAAIAALAVWTLSVYLVWAQRQEGIATAELAVLNTARVLTTQVESAVDQANVLLLSAGERYRDAARGGEDDVRRLTDQIRREIRVNPLLRRIGFADARGAVFFNSGFDARPSSLLDLSDREYFKRAMAGSRELMFEGPVKAKLDGEWALILSRRIDGEDGAFLGVAFAVLPVAVIGRELRKVDLGPSGVVNLRTADLAEVVRHPALSGPNAGIGNRNVSQTIRGLMRAYPEQDHFVYTAVAPIDDTERVYAYQRFGHSPLWMTVGRATADFATAWQRTAALLACVSLAVTGLLVWGTQRLARQNRQLESRLDEKNATEQRLRASESRFHALFDQAPIGLMLSDRDGNIVLLNRAIGDIVGYAQGELTTTAAWRQAVLSDAGAAQAACLDHAPGGGGQIECAVRCKDGTRKTLLMQQIRLDEDMLLAVIDITERKKAETALRESQERLQILIDHAPAALAMFDHDMRYLAVSNRWREDYALGNQAVLGRSHYDIFPEIPAHWKDVHRRGLAGEVVRAQEDPFERLDGSTHWLNWEVRPWHVGSGRVGGIVIFSEDVTARARMAQALKISEQKYRLLAESAQECIFWIDLAGRYRYISPSCLAQYGHPPEAFLGDPMLMSALVHPDDRDAFARHQAAVAAAEAAQFEFRIVREDGAERWIEQAYEPIFDAGGQHLGRRGVNQDITKRKLAERRVKALSEAVEQSPESIVITDLGARIEYVNDAFLKATGYDREAVIGRNPRFLQSGRTPPETYAEMWRCLGEGEVWAGKLYNRRRDGSEYTEFARISPLRDENGSITHYVAVKEDITEKMRMAQELEAHRHHLEQLVEVRTIELQEAKAQAESANRAKSAFLASMSHEIRTPMNGVLGMAGLLRRTPLDARQQGYLDSIETSGRHLLAIINDILDFSKIEAGKLELDDDEFTLSGLFSDVWTLIGGRVLAKRLAQRTQMPDGDLRLRGDRTRLAQSLVNYLGNAVKFTERGSVTLGCRIIDERAADYRLCFTVADTGIGMTADQAARVFEAFEQADGTISRKYHGTGLGLAITERIIHLMGGEVGVDSVPGEGSTFWLDVRLRKGQGAAVGGGHPAAPAEDQLAVEFGGRRVLLVEDEPINQIVAASLLEEVGLAVEVANNGREALQMLAAADYDLVLMDMQMPEVSGLEATRLLRAQPDTARLPIIAMTANAFEDDRAQCLAAGMDDFLAKPFTPEDLYALLLKWLRAGALARPDPDAATRDAGTDSKG